MHGGYAFVTPEPTNAVADSFGRLRVSQKASQGRVPLESGLKVIDILDIRSSVEICNNFLKFVRRARCGHDERYAIAHDSGSVTSACRADIQAMLLIGCLQQAASR
jgi:hypothetical protein